MPNTARPAHIALSFLLGLAQVLTACAGPTVPLSPTPASTAGPTPEPQAATRLSLTPLTPAVSRFGRAEFAIDTDGIYANPFDPAEVDLTVRFVGPDGSAVSVPAFFFQDFDAATFAPVGPPGWRVRFTPQTAGSWTATAVLAAPALESGPVAFDVAADDAARGFVRIDPDNPRYFAFDNGEPYVPIGANIAWATSLKTTTTDYARWFDRLSANGGNLARVWMASWSLGIEWQDTGLGDYRNRLLQAWLLDQVLDLAAARDVYVELCLLNHGAFSTSTNPEWDANPYNVANGGMLTEPKSFVSDPQAIAFFKRRLRYIAARWGYSPNVMAWEWWNEVSLTPISDEALKPWIQTMTVELQGLDPNNHLISSSYAGGSYTRIWREPELDFAQVHDYSGVDPIVYLGRELEKVQKNTSAHPKPALAAEQGFSAYGADTTRDREDITLHNGVWAPPFVGYAGTAFTWWWDTYLDPGDRWGVYRPFADFVSGERLASLAPGRGEIDPAAVALTLQNDTRALVWVRSQAYDAATLLVAKNVPDGKFETLSGLTLTVSGLADGAYEARWFSPQTGEWLTTVPAIVSGGAVSLIVPDFDKDLALKVVTDAP